MYPSIGTAPPTPTEYSNHVVMSTWLRLDSDIDILLLPIHEEHTLA